MTDLRTAAQQALERLRICYKVCGFPADAEAASDLEAALAEPDRAQKMRDAGYTRRPTLREMSEPTTEDSSAVEPVQEPVAHSVIAGALFDIMGWLTSRRERIVLSSADNASPAVEAITEFAKMRGLSLDDAKVQDWNTAIRARSGT